MRVAIISQDNTVVKDGVPMKSDCSALVADQISAVQWYDTTGEIEYIRHAKPNQTIDDFAPYQVYVDKAVPVIPPESAINPSLNSLRPKTIVGILTGGV